MPAKRPDEGSMNLSYKECRLCARQCGVDRTKRAGRCGMTDEIRAARAALHMWEEPCISGTRGSGAVFFSGCPLGCVFCQNRPIALGKAGQAITVGRLAEIFLELQAKGAHNINLVTPTHYVPSVIEAVAAARAGGSSEADSDSGYSGSSEADSDSGCSGSSGAGSDSGYNGGSEDNRLHIPVVYNTAAYESPATIRALKGTVDVFLPDLKYDDPELARKLCRAPDYFEKACAAIREMVELTGPPVFDSEGLLVKGVIVRHLILPGHTHDAIRILRYLHGTYGDEILISIMSQYTPMPGVETALPELGRRVTHREYDRVIDAALEMGLRQAYIQEGETASESFIPAFDGEGL